MVSPVAPIPDPIRAPCRMVVLAQIAHKYRHTQRHKYTQYTNKDIQIQMNYLKGGVAWPNVPKMLALA